MNPDEDLEVYIDRMDDSTVGSRAGPYDDSGFDSTAVEDTDRSIVTADINAQKRKSQVKLPTTPRVTEESNRSSTVKESSSSQDQQWEETPEGKFRCTICRREFGSARGVKTHISHHRRTHKCTICKEQLSADDA